MRGRHLKLAHRRPSSLCFPFLPVRVPSLLFFGVMASLLPRLCWSATPPSVLEQHPSPAQLGKVSLPFIANQGQYPEEVAFAAPTFGGTVFVAQRGQLVYTLPRREAKAQPHDGRTAFAQRSGTPNLLSPTEEAESKAPVVLREEVARGKHMQVSGEGSVRTRVNVLRGNDPSKWRHDLPAYERVSLGEVYPGITLHLHAYGQTVEKVFTVQPGARPEQIAMKLTGGRNLKVNAKGDLEVSTAYGPVTFSTPVAYQEIDGVKQFVKAAYSARGMTYGFTIGQYDLTKALVIDPILAATFLGGGTILSSSSIAALAVAFDGSVYVAGETNSLDFPGVTAAAADAIPPGFDRDGFVVRLDAALHTIEAATFLGGKENDGVTALAMDPQGKVYVAGETYSRDFPGITAAAADATLGYYSEGFVARLDAELRVIEAATFLGGGDYDSATALALDPQGKVYVAGRTSSYDFPGMTFTSAQPGFIDSGGFVARLDAALHIIEAATYLGSRGYVTALALDPQGRIYAAGWMSIEVLPGLTPAAADATLQGDAEGFVARLDAELRTIEAATFLGGADYESVAALALDSQGRIYAAGYTSSFDFPGLTPTAADATMQASEGFVVRLDTELHTIEAATFLGGKGYDAVTELTLGPQGRIYAAGWTGSRQSSSVAEKITRKRSADAIMKDPEGANAEGFIEACA